MNDSQAARPRSGPRWLTPRTLGGTVLLFGLGYAVWQPLAQLLLHAVWGEDWPFTRRAEWVRFALVAACAGLAVGAAWHAVQRMRPGWWRAWANHGLRMVALSMVLQARTFAPGNARWWIVLLATSAITGMVFAAVEHVFFRPGAPGEPSGAPSDSAA